MKPTGPELIREVEREGRLLVRRSLLAVLLAGLLIWSAADLVPAADPPGVAVRADWHETPSNWYRVEWGPTRGNYIYSEETMRPPVDLIVAAGTNYFVVRSCEEGGKCGPHSAEVRHPPGC